MANIFMKKIEGDNDILFISHTGVYKGMIFTDNSLMSRTGKLTSDSLALMDSKLLRFLFVVPTVIEYALPLVTNLGCPNNATLDIKGSDSSGIVAFYSTGNQGVDQTRHYRAQFNRSSSKIYITSPWSGDLLFNIQFTGATIDMNDGAYYTYTGPISYNSYHFAMIPEYGFFG